MTSDTDDPLDGRKPEIRRLCEEDGQFASVWEDYSEVLAVLSRLQGDPHARPEALRDYLRLRAELGRELADWLDRHRDGAPDDLAGDG